jgi:hypothetical protein
MLIKRSHTQSAFDHAPDAGDALQGMRVFRESRRRQLTWRRNRKSAFMVSPAPPSSLDIQTKIGAGRIVNVQIQINARVDVVGRVRDLVADAGSAVDQAVDERRGRIHKICWGDVTDAGCVQL